jgi:DNA-binding response OmpR family regulator
VGEIVHEESHPLWIIPNLPNLPIDVPCRASSILVDARPPYSRAVETQDRVPLYVLAVCEGMSGARSILVLDPDESFHRMLAIALRRRDFACEAATRTEDTRRKLETGTHEVMVVNLDVPDGLSLFHARRGDGFPVPVIAVTGRPTVATALQAFRAGAVDYLAKPVHREELLAAVEHAAEKARALRVVRGVEQLLGACTRWFRDVQVLLAVPGAWTLPPAIRDALTEGREGAALDQVLVRCLGAHEVGALTREREHAD